MPTVVLVESVNLNHAAFCDLFIPEWIDRIRDFLLKSCLEQKTLAARIDCTSASKCSTFVCLTLLAIVEYSKCVILPFITSNESTNLVYFSFPSCVPRFGVVPFLAIFFFFFWNRDGRP